ncbi:MAG: CPBP family intramembrane glutamic endopeptidase [Gammaproteobacteria bacterium]
MKAVWPLLGYVALVFFCGAILAYPIYQLLDPWWDGAAPFHKVVHRTLKLSALVALLPLMYWLGLVSRQHWGYGTNAGSFATGLGIGFLVGIASLGLPVVLLCLLEVRVLTLLSEMTLPILAAILAKAVVVGLVVGFVEETWFRGALFSVVSVLSRTAYPLSAIWITAVMFGLVHFIRTDYTVEPLEATWVDGFVVLAHSFHLFASSAFVDSFLALVAAGFLLGLVRQRWGHIAHCVGIHAGWVVVIKSTQKMTEVNHDSAFAFLVGNYDGVIGYLMFLVFGLLGVGYYARIRSRKTCRADG